jgi:hypothetical protein
MGPGVRRDDSWGYCAAPAIHPLREILFKRWIRGSSPRTTTEFVEPGCAGTI